MLLLRYLNILNLFCQYEECSCSWTQRRRHPAVWQRLQLRLRTSPLRGVAGRGGPTTPGCCFGSRRLLSSIHIRLRHNAKNWNNGMQTGELIVLNHSDLEKKEEKRRKIDLYHYCWARLTAVCYYENCGSGGTGSFIRLFVHSFVRSFVCVCVCACVRVYDCIICTEVRELRRIVAVGAAPELAFSPEHLAMTRSRTHGTDTKIDLLNCCATFSPKIF